MEHLINEFVMRLTGKIPDETLKIARQALTSTLQKYEVSEKSTELSTFHGQYPACYQAYFATKILEGLSKNTLENYKMYVEDMLVNIGKPIGEITSNDIRIYLVNTQRQRKLQNVSLEARRVALSEFFKWSNANDYISKNPMAIIPPIKCPQKKKTALTREEMELVRSACQTLREKAIVEFLHSTGARISELCNTNIADVSFSKSEVKLFGKGSKERYEPLSPRAKRYLVEYLNVRVDDSEALFVTYRKPNRRVQKQALEREIKTIGQRCGLPDLHPHKIRHTIATELYESGMELAQVQQFLGHASPDTTLKYIDFNQQQIKDNHRKYIA